MKCKNCNNDVDKSKLSKYANGNFCCIKCSHIWSTKNDNKNETKKANCIICGKEIDINKRASLKTCKCDKCKKIKTCSFCGQIKPCKRPDICKKHQLYPTLIKYFGFDESKIGTIDIYEEFDRIKNMLIEDYWDNKLSVSDMVNKYNHYHVANFHKIMDSLDITRRNLSNSMKNAIFTGNKTIPNNIKYKNGWHTTWKGNKVFYRSSYELEYAEILDEQRINYKMENLRILYWDSQKLCQRIAIPDFYLPESNTIVEIKSTWTYDEQNIKDKFKSYKEHGYKCKLILEKNY